MPEIRRCDYCGREIGEKQQAYVLNIEMFALAEPLVITEEDLQKDYMCELEELIQKMETIDVSEAEDQVHEQYRFILCSSCRHDIHHRLKARYYEN